MLFKVSLRIEWTLVVCAFVACPFAGFSVNLVKHLFNFGVFSERTAFIWIGNERSCESMIPIYSITFDIERDVIKRENKDSVA